MMSILYKMGEGIVVILHIYGARAIFDYVFFTKILNICIEKYKLEYLYQYPTRNKPKDLCNIDIHNLQYRRTKMSFLYIYGAGAIFYYFVITKTLNLSQENGD